MRLWITERRASSTSLLLNLGVVVSVVMYSFLIAVSDGGKEAGSGRCQCDSPSRPVSQRNRENPAPLPICDAHPKDTSHWSTFPAIEAPFRHGVVKPTFATQRNCWWHKEPPT